MSVEKLLEHYQALVRQEKSLNTRYLNLTETGAGLLNKLGKLQEELAGLTANFSGFSDISPRLLHSFSLGSTHNQLRASVEEVTEDHSEATQRSELLQVYFLLFLTETKDKLGLMLAKLQSYTGEEYLSPPWADREESFSSTARTEDLQHTGKVAAQLSALHADIPSLRLNVTTQDIKAVLSAATEEDTVLTLFAKLMELSDQRFTAKFAKTVADISAVFRMLQDQIEKVENDMDLLQLSEDQQSLYEEMQSEAIKTLPTAPKRDDRRKMSTLVRGVLEFKLRQAASLTDANMTALKADYHSYITRFIAMNQQRETDGSSLNGHLDLEESVEVAKPQDGDLSTLLKPSIDSDTSRDKQRKKFDFSGRNYERVLITEVAKTDARIKGVVEKSNSHTEKSMSKSDRSDRLPLLRPNRVIF